MGTYKNPNPTNRVAMKGKEKNMKTVPYQKNMKTVPYQKENKRSVSFLRTAARINILTVKWRTLDVNASLESASRMVMEGVILGEFVQIQSVTPTKTATANRTQRTASAMMGCVQLKPGSVTRLLEKTEHRMRRSVAPLRNAKKKSAPVWATHARTIVTKQKTARLAGIGAVKTLTTSASARGVCAME